MISGSEKIKYLISSENWIQCKYPKVDYRSGWAKIIDMSLIGQPNGWWLKKSWDDETPRVWHRALRTKDAYTLEKSESKKMQ